jgi:hypothetical protein
MAKAEWLKNGDRNTKYFHACSKQRMKKNLVRSIKDDVGRKWDSPQDVGNAFVNFFQSLLTSAGPRGMGECTVGIDCNVTTDMNQNLLRSFTSVEVKQALDQMAPLKAPGLDGFSADFYQQN